MASEDELIALRKCEREDCEYRIPNGVKDLKDILMAMANHLAAIHPASGGSEGGGGGKSNAPIPQLEENISEISWSAWRNRFDRWQLSCKISDKAVENRVFEAIPNALADQICVGLAGNKNKEALLTKIKAAVIKKRSVFLYRKDLHQIVQGRSEDPERYAARIRQAAPPCCLKTDNKTDDYSADLMSSIFILGLEDSYTKEKLFQIRPTAGNSTVEFDVLVKAASEIQQAKDNCLESGNTSVCGVSGSGSSGFKSKKKSCTNCNTTSHNEQGFSGGVRKKHCKAYNVECGKCKRKGHFTDACRAGQWGKKEEDKKAKVNVVSTVDSAAPDTSEVAVVSPSSAGAAGPVAALNSVQQVQREYSINPGRYSDACTDSGSFWAVSSSIPIQIQRLWGKMEARVESASTASQPLGHYIFDNESESWRRNSPPGHAAKKVRTELDRASYSGQGRTQRNEYTYTWVGFPRHRGASDSNKPSYG